MGSKVRKQRKNRSSKILENLPLINSALKSKDRKLRSALLGRPEIINSLSSIARNTVAGHVPIKCEKLKKQVFGRYLKDLTRLGDPKRSVESQRKFIQQKGSGILPILGAILPLAITALTNAFQR